VAMITTTSSTAVRPRVVIVGSGFGGLNTALGLAGREVDVTVVDRDNYQGFWPLLYQVATSGLEADDIASPIRSVLAGHPNIRVRLGTVTGVDLEARRVTIDGHPPLAYDYLVMAPGSSASDFGIPGVGEHAFPLKSLPDALRLRNHVLASFESADADADADAGRPGALTTVVVGGGSTGVEMAGALAELISHNLAGDFRDLDVGAARVVLVEMSDHLLPGYLPRSQEAARRTLEAKGVELRFATSLAEVTAAGVRLEDGETIDAATVVWTAGVKANPLAEQLPGAKGKGGRVEVEPDLSLPDHPEVFVLGDVALCRDRRGDPLPQVAQVAIQGARRTARNITRRIEGRSTRPFRYLDHGTMATIGRRSAVAELPGGLAFGGTIGWLAWLVVHLFFLVGRKNRVVVMVNWAWNYLTWDRANRVILDVDRDSTGPGSIEAATG
jgi:NADH dehydrogenase